jgi:hypothetical protein
MQEAAMAGTDFEFDEADDQASPVAGTPEGDGDFESDNLPSTGETSSGGQVLPTVKPESELKQVIDEISAGKIRP